MPRRIELIFARNVQEHFHIELREPQKYSLLRSKNTMGQKGPSDDKSKRNQLG